MLETNEARSSAHESLEDYQRQLYQNLGLSPPAPQDLTSLVQTIAKERAALLGSHVSSEQIEAAASRKLLEIQTLLKEAPPTQFEDLPTYINILTIAHQLEEGAQKSGVALSRPILGTVPLGGVNALTMLEGMEYIVAFSTGLFSFAELMGRSIAKTLPSTGVSQNNLSHEPGHPFFGFSLNLEDVKLSLQMNPAGAKCFVEAILSFVRWGRPDTSNMSKLDAVTDVIASLVHRHFLEFVIAHEYGHIYHKHLLNQNTSDISQGHSASRTIMWSWRQECEADIVACALMFVRSRTQPTNLPAALMGIEVFLSCYETVDRAVSTLSFGDEKYLSTMLGHPPARVRRGFIHQHLISRAHEVLEGSNAEAQMRSALNDAQKISHVVDLLWEQARPYLWQLYELGKSPHRIFGQETDALRSDQAMLGDARIQLKKTFPDVARTLEKAESVVLSSKKLLRASATALFGVDANPDQTQTTIDQLQLTIDSALKEVGCALNIAAQLLSELRLVFAKKEALKPSGQYQIAISTLVLAGTRLEAAGLIKANVAASHEGANAISEAGRLLLSVGELSSVGLHLAQLGETLGLAVEHLVRDDFVACWKATKLAGSMAVLSGEGLIRGAIELWRRQLLMGMAAALLFVADAIEHNRTPTFDILRDVLSLQTESVYALASSLRRSASFFRNITPSLPSAEAKFRTSAASLETSADILQSVAAHIDQAQRSFAPTPQEGARCDRMIEMGRIFYTAAKELGEAAATEQRLGIRSELTDIARVLSSTASYLAKGDSTQAAHSMNELAGTLRLSRF